MPGHGTNRVPPSTVASWLSRLVGVALIGEQGYAHLTGIGTDLLILGAGLFLLSGREGVEFLRLILGGGSGSSQGPPSAPPGSRS